MRTVYVASGQPPGSYRTFADAVSGAERHPSQEHARTCANLLERARVIGGLWRACGCEIIFSNSRLLRVRAHNYELKWTVEEARTDPETAAYTPVQFVWNSEVKAVFDPASLVAAISGTDFVDLFVNEVGLLLYTQGNPILWFHALRDRELGQDFLFAAFE